MKVLMPLPSCDFDPTESSVTWRIVRDAGHDIAFATPDGKKAQGDLRMLKGLGLGPFKWILAADKNARQAYGLMESSAEFESPRTWESLDSNEFDALILPGGHAPGMRDYLESKKLQSIVAEFMAANKVVGAICHGVVLAARSTNTDGTSVLKGRRTTCLLRVQEFSAWALTCLWLGSYYRTYPESVESEVRRALASPNDFESGPAALLRDTPQHLERGFVVVDRNYVSARWPGDAHRFGKALVERLS